MSSDHHRKSDYSGYVAIGYPVRHRRKDPFYPMLALDLDTRGMIREIRELDSSLGGYVLSEQDYRDLVLDAYSSNIHWSTRIEGNRMTLEEVGGLATEYMGGRIEEVNDGDAQEIINHLDFHFKEESRMPWSLDTVLSVHRNLMAGIGNVDPGVIRDMDVCVRGSDGTELFIACPKGSVETELRSLMDWVNTTPFGDIVTATLFFHEFESIHPFEDGNGRTGRALFQALLKQLGLPNCDLCRFEEEMLSDTATYYDLLAYTDSTGNYTPLVRYVSESILCAYREAVDEFSSRDRLKGMDENTRFLAMKAKKKGSFLLQDASSWLPIGESAMRRRLDELVGLGILGKEGRTRSLRYVFLDPFRDLRGRLGRS